MSRSRFVLSIAANIDYWREHTGLADPGAWPALDNERGNLIRAVEYGLRLPETWPAAAELALQSYTYVFERGHWSEWVLVMEQALASLPGDSSVLEGRLAQQMGSLYRKLRRLDDAQTAHEQAEALGRAQADALLEASAQLGLGRVYLRRCQYERAEQYAGLALANFEAHGRHPVWLAHTHSLLAIIALRRGDHERSVQEFYRSRDLFRQSQQSIELGRTIVNLAEALSRLGRADEALALFEEAEAIFAKHDLQLERSRLYTNLGFLHYSQDDLAQAETAFRQAYSPYMRRAGPVYLRSLIEMNLGNALLIQGHAEESRVYFQSAVSGFRLVNAHMMLANSLDGLAETSLAGGDRQEAVALYEEALEIVTAIPEDAFARRAEPRYRALLAELRAAVDEK